MECVLSPLRLLLLLSLFPFSSRPAFTISWLWVVIVFFTSFYKGKQGKKCGYVQVCRLTDNILLEPVLDSLVLHRVDKNQRSAGCVLTKTCFGNITVDYYNVWLCFCSAFTSQILDHPLYWSLRQNFSPARATPDDTITLLPLIISKSSRLCTFLSSALQSVIVPAVSTSYHRAPQQAYTFAVRPAAAPRQDSYVLKRRPVTVMYTWAAAL